MLTWAQISGGLDRLVLAILVYLAAKYPGYIDSDQAGILAPAIVAALGIVYGIVRNRISATLERAADTGATVIAPNPVAVKSPKILSQDEYMVIKQPTGGSLEKSQAANTAAISESKP